MNTSCDGNMAVHDEQFPEKDHISRAEAGPTLSVLHTILLRANSTSCGRDHSVLRMDSSTGGFEFRISSANKVCPALVMKKVMIGI